MERFKCAHSDIKSVAELLLIQNPKNNNKHSKEQIDRLAKIIDFQGQRSPIVISKRSGFIVKGHGRLMALDKLKWQTAAVDYQEYNTEAEEYADMTADNEIARWAEFNEEKFLEDIKTIDLGDLDLLGLKDIPEILQPENEGLTDEDATPEIEQNIHGVKLGNIYQLGNHRLMCGDSTDLATVEKLMNGEKADMVFTDPPYGMRLDTDYRSMGSKNNFRPVAGDNDDFRPELIQTLLKVFSYCEEVFLFGADYYAELIEEKNEGSWVVWDKRSNGEKHIGILDGSFGSDFELCWSKSKHQRKICRVIRNNGAFIKKREGVDTLHPTQKPVEMVEWFFGHWGKNRTKVVDLYGGSGSTLIACEKTNRKCFMMELDPHYCSVIIERWQQFTGKKAELLNG